MINWAVSTSWVREHYPVFLRALHVMPMPFKDFAKELKTVMPKRRRSHWKGGKRTGRTSRYYAVRDPSTNVVDLAAARRETA